MGLRVTPPPPQSNFLPAQLVHAVSHVPAPYVVASKAGSHSAFHNPMASPYLSGSQGLPPPLVQPPPPSVSIPLPGGGGRHLAHEQQEINTKSQAPKRNLVGYTGIQVTVVWCPSPPWVGGGGDRRPGGGGAGG